jgi:hypothetical protein
MPQEMEKKETMEGRLFIGTGQREHITRPAGSRKVREELLQS